MSVLIKGMTMPTNCRQCSLYLQSMDSERNVYENCAVTAKSYNWGLSGRPSDCPLVPVPTHGRLIDADALLKEDSRKYVEYRVSNGRDTTLDDTCHRVIQWTIENAPTVIEAEGAET